LRPDHPTDAKGFAEAVPNAEIGRKLPISQFQGLWMKFSRHNNWWF
jgi:hypothetical protein